MIRIRCDKADAYLIETQTLTAGMVNLPVVRFSFADDWEDYGKVAVVRAGDVRVEKLITGDQIIVPAECMVESGVNLIVGVYGANASEELPTVWCACGEILDGTDPSTASNDVPAETSNVAQMLEYAESIEQYSISLAENIIHTVIANDDNANRYGEVGVALVDSGAGQNRTLTFTFTNLKGNGIEALVFTETGENKGNLQVRLSDGTVTNFTGIKEALISMADTEADVEAAEALRVTAETLRVAAEEARATAEDLREDAEEDRVTAEQARETAEQTRTTNETDRRNYETARRTQETIRNQHETAREQAEDDRADAEAQRVLDEQSRANAEASRVTAEQGRVSAESDRVTAEDNRASAESGRVSAENQRVTAESGRATAETQRASAETARATAESNRSTAESDRVTAETSRASAETSRANAESARVTAENARVSAETARATEFGTWESTIAAKADKTEVDDLKDAFAIVEDTVLPQTFEATEALAYYPLAPEKGNTVVIKSKNGTAYTKTWAALFYASDQSTILQQADVTASETTKEIIITVSGIAYFRPNVNFSGDAYISVMSGSSLVEKVDANTADIASNTIAIAENAKEIANIKNGENDLYTGISLISGRVYDGVYSDAITTTHCTDYLPITPGRIYAIYGGYFDVHYSSCYDANKIYKGALPLDGLNKAYPYNNSYNFLLFTAPSDAYYTRINYFNSDLVDGDKLKPAWFFRDVTDLVWAKKKVLVMGDSISTDVYGGYKKWVTDLLDEGFITTGLVTNSSQHATGFVATYSGQANTTFLARLTALGDLTGFDSIITFGGINDWIQHIDFDTFKSAVDSYFAYLIENATQARIIVFSPLHTALYGTTNSVGKTQKDYDDYIKSVAKEYAFPCLNLTDESGFCPDKSTTFNDMWTLIPAGYSDHDGVHPIEAWEKNFLAPMIKGFLETIG